MPQILGGLFATTGGATCSPDGSYPAIYIGATLSDVNIMQTATAKTWTIWSSIVTSTTGYIPNTSAITPNDATWRDWIAQHLSEAQLSDALLERRTARETYEQQERERARRRQEAVARAERLLLELLTPAQREDFKARQFFIVEAPNGIRYRIRKGRSGNIDVVGRDGRIMHGLCIHPYESVPDADTMIAQKLHLESGDEQFLQLANRLSRGSDLILPPLH